MGQAKIVGNRNFHFFEAYTCAAITYWILCIIIEFIVKMIEKKLNFLNRDIREPSEEKVAELSVDNGGV